MLRTRAPKEVWANMDNATKYSAEPELSRKRYERIALLELEIQSASITEKTAHW